MSQHLLSRVANIAGGSRTVEVYFDEKGNRSKISNAGKVAVNSNAPYNRNPFYLKPKHKGVVTKKIRKGLSDALRAPGASASVFLSALDAVGDYMVEQFKKQLLAMDYKDGHADLKPEYKKWKQRKVGRVYPILQLHGDLLRSISYRMVK